MSKVVRAIKTSLVKIENPRQDCDDCQTLIPQGVLAVLIMGGPVAGIPMHFILHKRCAVNLGGDLAGEITRV